MMLTQEQFQELLSYEADGKKVLSLYLDADISQQPIDMIKLQMKGMIKEANVSHCDDVNALERYLDHSFDWSKPGLAAFSADDGQFFRAFPVNVSFRNRLRVGHRPYVKPLAHLLDHYAHYGVVIVDRVGARFFEFHLGELQETEGYMGEDIRKLKTGKGSSAVGTRGGQGGSRHEEEAAQRNLREAAAAANAFFSRKPIRRLFLGGTAETVSQVRDLLPKQLQSCVAGAFAIDMDAGETEVRKRSLALLREANDEREKRLVQQLIATEAKGGTAVIGLDDTLQAVSEKRIQTLIISDGYRTPGYEHDVSGFVVANLARSPLAEEELTAVEDVVDSAVMQTMTQGGHVEVISENPDLEKVGRIGAILRY
jgi:peptide subunit release factor 1 (eRF1)